MAEKPAPRTLLIVTASAVPAQSPRRGERAARVRDLLREQILADRYAGRPCAYVEFRTYVDGVPFNVNNSYLPESIAKVLTPGIFEGDFYEFLEAHGLAVVSGDLMVEAINADELTAAALGIPCGTAVML